MKILVDGKELLTLTDIQKRVIMNDIPEEEFEEDMKRRLKYVLMHKYERCYARLFNEWMPKLKEAGVQHVPLNDELFANLVFEQPEYKSRSQRELE